MMMASIHLAHYFSSHTVIVARRALLHHPALVCRQYCDLTKVRRTRSRLRAWHKRPFSGTRLAGGAGGWAVGGARKSRRSRVYGLIINQLSYDTPDSTPNL